MSQTKSKASAAALTGPKRTSAQKAAAVLALLDDETLRKLAGRLSDRHKTKLLSAIKDLKIVDVKEQKRIAQEFAVEVARGRNAMRGSETVAERLQAALFSDSAVRHHGEDGDGIGPEEPEEEAAEPVTGSAVWGEVAKLPVAILAQFFSGKSSSVLSVAMHALPDDVVSEMVAELDEADVKAAMVHLATNGKPNPVAVGAVENLLSEELLNPDEPIADIKGSNPNVDRVAGFLNRMISSRRDKLMASLREELPEDEMAEIEARVLSFAALEQRLPRSAIPMVLRELDEKAMLTALKFANEKHSNSVDYLLKNISQRMAGQYREKMDEMPKIDEEEGEKALSKFVCTILDLADAGKFELLTPE